MKSAWIWYSLFVLVFGLGVLRISRQFGREFARDGVGSVARYAVWTAPLALFGSFLSRPHPAWEFLSDALGWWGYAGMGFLSFYWVARELVNLGQGGLALLGQKTTQTASPQGVSVSRRGLMRGWSNAAVVGGSALLAGASVQAARKVPAVRKVDIGFAGWPDDVPPLRVVQLTDIHAGPTIKKDYVQALVDTTNALVPDLVLLTGDLVDGRVDVLADDVAPVGGLVAPLGTYFVTGNHEYYSGVEHWLAYLPKLGIRVLHNESVELPLSNGQQLLLSGITDFRAERFGEAHASDVGSASLPYLDKQYAARVMLAHQPRSIAAVENHGYDLQISGHTHGGQFWPWSWAVYLAQPYVWGLHAHKKMQIYVSRGSGYWGPPMRLGAPSEITLFSWGPKQT